MNVLKLAIAVLFTKGDATEVMGIRVYLDRNYAILLFRIIIKLYLPFQHASPFYVK